MLRNLAASVLLSVLAGAWAFASPEDPYYRDQAKNGYYNYEDPPAKDPEPPKAKKKQQVEQTETPAKKERRIPSLKDYTAQELWDMYPDDVVELEEDFRKKAVQHPTKENVKEHLYIKDLARRKAVAYTNSYMVALQENPDMNLERDLPMIPGAKAVMYKETESERRNKIAISRDDFALIYFASTTCSYCVEQDKILGYFKGRSNWTIKKVDKDMNPEMASRFNVTMTPSLLLIRKGRDDFMHITSGIISLTDLEDRVFNGIRLMNNETKPENYTVREFQKGGPLDASGPLPIK